MNRLYFSIIMLLVPFHTATAETTTLSVRGAITMAMEKNNLVKAAGFRSGAAREEIAIAGSRYYPDIFFEEAFTASNAPTQAFMMKLDQGRFTQNDFLIDNLNKPATQHDFKTALTIQQPLYSPSLAPARALAVIEAEKESAGFDATREEIAFQVFNSYQELSKAAAQLRSAEHAIADARENRRLAAVRSKQGIGLRSDELRAATHLASVEQQLITARNNLALARMRLAIIVGLKEGAEVEISEPAANLAVALSPEELSRTALENRGDLRRIRSDVEKGGAAINLASSAYLPSLGAFASYQMNAKDTPFGSDNDAWLAGVNLKWQIFDGFRRGHETRKAEAGRSAAAELLEARERESRFQVRESLLRSEEAGKRLEVARHVLLDAEETVRLLSRRFENSLATMAELLDAQTALNQARSNLVDSEAEHALAIGRVYHTAGIFLKEVMR